MAELTSYIIIDRNILKWRHFKDDKCLRVFLWLLLNVNGKPKRGYEQYFNKGEITTTYEAIAEGIGVSLMSVRRAIEALKKSGEILVFRQKHGNKIVVKNYRKYQNENVYKNKNNNDFEAEDDNSRVFTIEHSNEVECSKSNFKSVQNDTSRVFTSDRSIYTPTNVVVYKTKTEGLRPKDKDSAHTRDDIPLLFRDRFETYEEYEKWRYQ